MARLRTPAASAPWRWAAAGAALGLVVALVLFAPARWLASAVNRATNSQLQLLEPRGTIWKGSAQLVLTGGPGSSDAAAFPGRLDWTLAPRFNGLAARIGAACCMEQPARARLRVKWGGGSFWLGAANMQFPAAVLSGLGTPWNTLQPEGEMRMATQGLSVEWAEGRLAMTGGAELVAHNLSSRLSTLRPMGSYRITLQGGSAPTVRLSTIDGALQMEGTGQWVGRRLRFSGEASAAPESEAALSNLLNIMGRRSGSRSIISIG